MPNWLHDIAWLSLFVGFVCTVILLFDEFVRPQHMWIMNVVWPITALYAGPLALWAYYRYGLPGTKRRTMEAKEEGREPPSKNKSFAAMVALAATHCGAGCTLGDVCAEWLVFFTGLILWPLPHHPHIVGAWIIDFIFAFAFGIVFEYFTIVPMRSLSVGKGIWAAIKADTLSLTAWQVGMCGWMGIVSFLIVGHELPKNEPFFWFMMQIAMLCGLLTSLPVNWWLLSVGLKEKM